jgi:3-phenylpropionate/cinnamic acid dioxygenase small subunit
MTTADQIAGFANEGGLRDRVAQFLGLEALLLDEGRFEEWFSLLDDALLYEVPLRHAVDRRAVERPDAAFAVRDNKAMIRVRLDKLKLENSHAESPASRTVRSVSSLCLLPDSAPGIIAVSSALTVFRQRGADLTADVLHARRNDRLRITTDGLRLVMRLILFAETTLRTPNLAIFF